MRNGGPRPYSRAVGAPGANRGKTNSGRHELHSGAGVRLATGSRHTVIQDRGRPKMPLRPWSENNPPGRFQGLGSARQPGT
jgi:hypothetical protein